MSLSHSPIFPDDDETLRKLGHEAARLLTDHPDFVRRRKEKVSLLDETTARRQMSVDFELPASCKPMHLCSGQETYYAPLLFLQKGSDRTFDPQRPLDDPEAHFANFDFRDAGGGALTLPSRVWNAKISVQMMQKVFADAVAYQGLTVDDELMDAVNDFLTVICTSEQFYAVGLLIQIRDQAVEEPMEVLVKWMYHRDGTFGRLLDACAISSVVMLPLDEETARKGIIKLYYDEQLSDLRRSFSGLLSSIGWRGLTFFWAVPVLGAETYHFEAEAPEGLEIYEAGLVRVPVRPLRDSTQPNSEASVARVSGRSSRVHLYTADAERQGESVAWVRFRVRRQAFIGGAVQASLLVTAVLWLAYAFRKSAHDAPTSVPALMLLFPSVVAGYAARPDPHRLTAMMLRSARRLLGISAALPFVAAGALAVSPRKNGMVDGYAFADWWYWLAFTASIISVLLIGGRLLPVSKRALKEAKEMVLGWMGSARPYGRTIPPPGGEAWTPARIWRRLKRVARAAVEIPRPNRPPERRLPPTQTPVEEAIADAEPPKPVVSGAQPPQPVVADEPPDDGTNARGGGP